MRFKLVIEKAGQPQVLLGKFMTYEEAIKRMFTSLNEIYIYPTKVDKMIPHASTTKFNYPGRTYYITRIKGENDE